MLAPGHKSVRDYVSDRVYDGVRPVSAATAAQLRAAYDRHQASARMPRARGIFRLFAWMVTFSARVRQRLSGRSPSACRHQV
jgi:hypothetical protein